MNPRLFLPTLFVLATMTGLSARVPINYQGRLTESASPPFNGTKSFHVRIYDAAAGGPCLYWEDIGQISIVDGIFRFAFGLNGTSSQAASEGITWTDDYYSQYNRVLQLAGAIGGTLEITDGVYSWSEATGSSSPENFTVAYTPATNAVTINYPGGPPPSGRLLLASFRSESPGGIFNALYTGGEIWLELSINGVPQTPRQRILAVPFAMKADGLTPDGIEEVVRPLRQELQSVYDVLAAIVAAGGVPSPGAQVEGNMKTILFNPANSGNFTTSSSFTAQGVDANKIQVLSSLSGGTASAVFPVDNFVRYFEWSDSYVTANWFGVDVEFVYADGTRAAVNLEMSGAQGSASRRFGNPQPGKRVASISRVVKSPRVVPGDHAGRRRSAFSGGDSNSGACDSRRNEETASLPHNKRSKTGGFCCLECVWGKLWRVPRGILQRCAGTSLQRGRQQFKCGFYAGRKWKRVASG